MTKNLLIDSYFRDPFLHVALTKSVAPRCHPRHYDRLAPIRNVSICAETDVLYPTGIFSA